MDNIIKDIIVGKYAIDVLYDDYSNWNLMNEQWLGESHVIYTIRNKDNTIEATIGGNTIDEVSFITEIKL